MVWIDNEWHLRQHNSHSKCCHDICLRISLLVECQKQMSTRCNSFLHGPNCKRRDSGDTGKEWRVVSVELKWSIKGASLLRHTREVAHKHGSTWLAGLSSVLRANFVRITLVPQSRVIYIFIYMYKCIYWERSLGEAEALLPVTVPTTSTPLLWGR